MAQLSPHQGSDGVTNMGWQVTPGHLGLFQIEPGNQDIWSPYSPSVFMCQGGSGAIWGFPRKGLSFPGGALGNAGDAGLISGSGRSPGGGHGNPLQYFCLENPMDRGDWWTTVHGVTESQTQLNMHTHTHTEGLSQGGPPRTEPSSWMRQEQCLFPASRCAVKWLRVKPVCPQCPSNTCPSLFPMRVNLPHRAPGKEPGKRGWGDETAASGDTNHLLRQWGQWGLTHTHDYTENGLTSKDLLCGTENST